MKSVRRCLVGGLVIAVGLLCTSAVFPARAHAYIDPVSGSIILQVLAAGVLAAAFTFKRFMYRIRHAARSIRSRLWTS
jgi:hypothetical protein